MISKLICKLSTLLLIFLLVACGEDNKNDLDAKIKIGVASEYPPFAVINHGEMIGFDIDLANQISNKIGQPIEFVDIPFHALLSALKHNEINIAMSAISKTPLREKIFLFSDSYYQTFLVLIYSKDHEKRMFDGMKVGVLAGTTMQDWANDEIKARFPNAKIKISYQIYDLLRMLHDDTIDFIIMEESVAQNVKNINGDINYRRLTEGYEEYGIVMNKSDIELAKKINHALKELRKEGVINDLEKKWLKYE